MKTHVEVKSPRFLWTEFYHQPQEIHLRLGHHAHVWFTSL